jgi:DNA-binding CsgD family transcriptional regulator
MTMTEQLRPVERLVLRWTEAGADDAEIAERFGRGERWVAQVRTLAGADRPGADGATSSSDDDPLRPIERRVLRWLEQGADYDELGLRFRRSPELMARIEEYAHYKLANA